MLSDCCCSLAANGWRFYTEKSSERMPFFWNGSSGTIQKFEFKRFPRCIRFLSIGRRIEAIHNKVEKYEIPTKLHIVILGQYSLGTVRLTVLVI